VSGVLEVNWCVVGGLIIYVSYNGGREEEGERGRERERERLVRGGGSPILFIGGLPRWKGTVL